MNTLENITTAIRARVHVRRSTIDPSKTLVPYAFISPAMLILISFMFIPVLLTLILSLTNFDLRAVKDLARVKFVGLENYLTLLQDGVFRHALLNTFIFVIVGLPMVMASGLIVALLLNMGFIRLKGLFRLGYYLPVISTTVAVATVWKWIYNSQVGLANWFLQLLGIPGIAWLVDTRFALLALIIMATWKNLGYSMVIFLAGLQGIPEVYYEAAAIDGASPLRRFWHVTLPMLRPTTLFVTIITLIGYFQFFAEPYVMTDQGGPADATLSIVLYLYKQGFLFFNLGYASAVANFLALIILVATVIQMRIQRPEFL